METVQVEVSPELAQLLQSHSDNLAQIIEWGVWVAEERDRQALVAAMQAEPPEHSKIEAALHASGLIVKLEATLAARYQGVAGRSRRTPVYVRGKPLSEVIVAERGPKWPEEP